MPIEVHIAAMEAYDMVARDIGNWAILRQHLDANPPSVLASADTRAKHREASEVAIDALGRLHGRATLLESDLVREAIDEARKLP